MSALRRAALAALAVALAGCTVGPDYVRPAVEVPPAYKEWKPAEPRDADPRGEWWGIFNDPVLAQLEAQVAVSNQNVAQAEAQYRQAVALAQAARAAYFPTVNATLANTRSRQSSTISTQAIPANQLVLRAPVTIHSLTAGVSSWEVDLWGHLRRAVEAGTASAQASAGDLESARLSAQAQLAQDYFQLRVLDAQRKLLDDTVAAYQRSLELVRNQYAAGVASRADVVQAQTQLASARAQAIDLGVQRAQLEHAIAVLLGKPPAEFSLAPVTDFAPALPEIPPGIPSALLERRPDIAAAERRMAAANAQIGVAQAAFYPAFTLSLSAGYQSTDLAQWFTVPSRVWSVGPALAQVLFDGGLRRAQSEGARAAYAAAVAAYRQTVLGGFQEVEDNLAALRILAEESEVQAQAVQSAEEALRLALNQYKAGTVNYLSVVVAQTALLANQRAALTVLGARLAASVQLVKALGGGWNTSGLPTQEQVIRGEARP